MICTNNRVLISDDLGETFRPSMSSFPRGGEGAIALAPNLTQHQPYLQFAWAWLSFGRYQSESHDGGDTWSSPRLFAQGFGSSAEGALIGLNGSSLMLFSHGGQVNGSAGRWNMIACAWPIVTRFSSNLGVGSAV